MCKVPVLICKEDDLLFIGTYVTLILDDIPFHAIVTGTNDNSIEIRLSYELQGIPYIFTDKKFERFGFIKEC